MTTKAKTKMTVKAQRRADIIEAASDLAALGVMTTGDVEKITLRMLGADALPHAASLSGREITSIREAAGLSQAVFGRLLDVSTGTISKWERGDLAPRGPARRLLQLIKRKGIAAVLV